MIVLFIALVFFAGATAGAMLTAICHAAATDGDGPWYDR